MNLDKGIHRRAGEKRLGRKRQKGRLSVFYGFVGTKCEVVRYMRRGVFSVNCSPHQFGTQLQLQKMIEVLTANHKEVLLNSTFPLLSLSSASSLSSSRFFRFSVNLTGTQGWEFMCVVGVRVDNLRHQHGTSFWRNRT